MGDTDQAYCADIACIFCILRRMAKSGGNLLRDKPPTEEQARANWAAMYPPTLKQRIWAKFCTMAQWVRPGRN